MTASPTSQSSSRAVYRTRAMVMSWSFWVGRMAGCTPRRGSTSAGTRTTSRSPISTRTGNPTWSSPTAVISTIAMTETSPCSSVRGTERLPVRPNGPLSKGAPSGPRRSARETSIVTDVKTSRWPTIFSEVTSSRCQDVAMGRLSSMVHPPSRRRGNPHAPLAPATSTMTENRTLPS